MKNYLLIALLTLFLVFSLKTTSSKNNSKRINKKPNVVFILTDDQGYGDLSCHDNPILKTPHMDRLHDESVCFTDFMVSPTCAPTRAAIYSGMHEFKAGVTHTLLGRSNMYKEVNTVADILKTAGYITGLFGKWHLGVDSIFRPEHRGFDVALTSLVHKVPSHYDPILGRNGVEEKYKGYRTDVFFNEAIKFIEENKEKPFFCHIPTYSPHSPLIVPDKYSDKYGGNRFFGMIDNIDENIGKLMTRLFELGLDKNTLVILINDNGATYGSDFWNYNMRGVKCTAWNGGTRALSFWRWPNQLTPGNVDKTTAHVDILPTLAEICGAEIPAKTAGKLDGRSLVPLFESQNTEWSDRVLITHVGRWNIGARERHKYCQAAVRWKQYSLVRIETCEDPNCRAECRGINRVANQQPGYYSKLTGHIHYALTQPQGKWALYDLEKDVRQDNNIAANHPDIVAKMSEDFEHWWNDVFGTQNN